MSASGSTPHLHLSQYTDTDHPSYVSDYTEDMGRIDTGFNLAQTNALTALNRVAALEQSISSAGAVGQTVSFQVETTVDSSVSDGKQLLLSFGVPSSTMTRSAEPVEVPWTWESTDDMARLAFADRGVYRVTVEAFATYRTSPNISSAYIQLSIGQYNHCVPLVLVDDSPDGRYYSAAGSFVVAYDGDGGGGLVVFGTSFSDSSVPGAQVQCQLYVDVEQLSTQYSERQ